MEFWGGGVARGVPPHPPADTDGEAAAHGVFEVSFEGAGTWPEDVAGRPRG
jgi:hypothetical protein